MDQLKDFLKQVVKYRFWILVGVASLMPLIGYFVASGTIKDEEKKQRDLIDAAYKDVHQYESGTVVNNQYEPLVKQKTAVLAKDVNASWKKLYERQAPFLNWPELVQGTFDVWNRKWPEGVARNVIQDAIIRYTESYDPPEAPEDQSFVKQVYKTFKPFDPESGEGIVAAPPYELLMRPAKFETAKLPKLGDVYAAQEKLWIQRTVFDVIAKVNERAKAKDWDTAVIKQILSLEVANAAALDQKSIAQAKALTDAPAVTDPDAPAEPTEAGAGSAAASGGAGMPDMASQMRSVMGGMGGPMGASGMSGGPGAGGPPEAIKYLESPNPEQYVIVPIFLDVYVDQAYLTDLLVEFQNSPMNIQILDVEIRKPAPGAVKKPVKGQNLMQSYGGMMMMSGSMMKMGMMSGGYGEMMMGAMGSASGYGGSMGDYGGMSQRMMGMSGMQGNMGGSSQPKKQGTVIEENVNKGKAKKKADQEKEKEEAKPESKFADPYFYVVEVRVKGHARFYRTPPADEPAPTSESDPATADAAKAEAPAGEESAKAEAPKAETPKDESAKAEPKAPPADEPKADGAKPEAPKAEAPKEPEPAPKAEAPPAEAGKAEPAPPKDEPKR